MSDGQGHARGRSAGPGLCKGVVIAPFRYDGVSLMIRKEDLVNDRKYMTIEEVANLLRYSVKTIYKKASRGEIPSIPLSRRKRLFSRDALEYWLANKRTGDL